jgi:hypothetical protein
MNHDWFLYGSENVYRESAPDASRAAKRFQPHNPEEQLVAVVRADCVPTAQIVEGPIMVAVGRNVLKH